MAINTEPTGLKEGVMMKVSIASMAALALAIGLIGCGGGSSNYPQTYQPLNSPEPQLNCTTDDQYTQTAFDMWKGQAQQLFDQIHPVGTVHSLGVNEVCWLTRRGTNQIQFWSFQMTLYWTSPLHGNGDGFTKVRVYYDNDIGRATDVQLEATNGSTKADWLDGALRVVTFVMSGYFGRH